MNTRVLLFSLLCALPVATGLQAAEGPSHGAYDHRGGGHKHTILGDHMEKMGHAFRQLNRDIADPAKNAESLHQVAILRTNAEAASKLKPAMTADIPADQQAKFVASYQEQMKGLLADIEKLGAALQANNNTEAAALLKTLKHDQFEGHKKFRKKEHHWF